MESLADGKKSDVHVEHIDKSDQMDHSPLVSAYAELTINQALRKFWWRYLVGLSGSVCAMYLGFTLAIPGAVTANQGFINQFGTVRDAAGKIQLDANHVGAWNGVNFGSQVLFQAISPFTAQKFGRKFNLYFLTFFILLAIILEIVSKEWKLYLVAKVICGFAAGFIGTSVTAYISEVTIPQFRGSHLACFSFAYALGGLFSAIGMEVLEKTNPLAYKHAFYSEFVIVGLWIPILILLPESPPWLIKTGRHEKGKKALRRIVGNVAGYDLDHEYAVLCQEIRDSEALAAKSSKNSFLACFKGTNLRRTLVSTIPFSMQNFVGGPLMFNAAYFFKTIGMTNAFQSNLIISCVLLAGILASFYLVDKAGRRPLLIMGGIVMCACDLIVGGMGVLGINGPRGEATVALVSIWVLAYSLSCGPIGWMSLVELSTPVLRTQTAGIAAILQSLNGLIFNYCVPLMLSDQYAGWGAKTGFFFGPLAAIFTVLVWFAVPESKGRSYTELDELFERRLPAWRFKNAITSVQEERERGRE